MDGVTGDLLSMLYNLFRGTLVNACVGNRPGTLWPHTCTASAKSGALSSMNPSIGMDVYDFLSSTLPVEQLYYSLPLSRPVLKHLRPGNIAGPFAEGPTCIMQQFDMYFCLEITTA